MDGGAMGEAIYKDWNAPRLASFAHIAYKN